MFIRVPLVLIYYTGEWIGMKIEWLLENVFKGLDP